MDCFGSSGESMFILALELDKFVPLVAAEGDVTTNVSKLYYLGWSV